MRGVPRAICLWPGLPQLWLRGSWTGLAWAIGFSLLLNFTFVVSFVWIEWVSPSERSMVWAVLGVFWLGSVIAGARWWGRESTGGDLPSAGPYEAALADYLQGNWLAAETAWHQALAANPRDIDALLMLATLYRHGQRYDEAEQMLKRLERIETSLKWQEEIAAEKKWLAERETAPVADDEPASLKNVSQSEVADAA